MESLFSVAVSWPIELFRAQEWLISVEIPRLVRAGRATVKTITHTVTRVVRPIERTIVKLPKLSRAQARALVAAAVATYIGPFLSPLHWLRAHFHALTAVLPHAIPLQWGRTVSGIRKRLRRLERITTRAGAIALVVAAIGEAAVRLFKCPQFLRAGQTVCRLDRGLFESLLLDAVSIASLLSVVEFATELRTVEDEALTLMGKLVREWPS